MSTIENITYKIRKIKEISFFVNEKLKVQSETKTLIAEVNFKLGFSIENNLVELIVLALFRYPGEDQPSLAETEVQNIFEISNLNNFLIDQSYIKLPPYLIINLVGMSISHARALLSQNLLGTVFQEEILTIMNPIDVAKHFYPYMFDEQNENLPQGQMENTEK